MKKFLFLLAIFVSALLYPDISRAADAETITDEITASALGITGTNYTSFSSKTISKGSGAQYSGKAANQGSNLMFKNNSGNGIWVSKSPEGYKLQSITFTYYAGTETMSLYTSTTDYAVDLSSAPSTTAVESKKKATFTYNDFTNETAFCFYTDGTTSKTSQWTKISVTWVKAGNPSPSITKLVYGDTELTKAPSDPVRLLAATDLKIYSANADKVTYTCGDDNTTHELSIDADGMASIAAADFQFVTYNFSAVKNGTDDAEEESSDLFSITFEQIIPAKPVITIGDTDYTDGSYQGYGGTAVTITADDATEIWYCEGDTFDADNATKLDADTFTLPDVATTATYTFKGRNDGYGFGNESATLTFTPQGPGALTVSYGDYAITNDADTPFAIINGQSLNIYAEGALTYTVKESDNEAVELTPDENGVYKYFVYTFDTPITFTASNKVGAVAKTLTFSQSTEKIYKQITNVADIEEDAHYIIASAEYGKAMTNEEIRNGSGVTTNLGESSVTFSDFTENGTTYKQISNPNPSVIEFVLDRADDATEDSAGWEWMLNGTDGLNLDSTNGFLNISNTAVTASYVTFDSNGNALIYSSKESTSNWIQYNASSNSFSLYKTSSNTQPVQLYKLVEVVTHNPKQPAVAYTFESNTTITANGEAYTVPQSSTLSVSSKYADKLEYSYEAITAKEVAEDGTVEYEFGEAVDYTLVENSDSYSGEYPQGDGRYTFKGYNELGGYSEPFTVVFEKDVTLPDTPVVTIGTYGSGSLYTCTDGEELEILPGTTINVSSNGATDIYDGDKNYLGDNTPYIITFGDEAVSYTFYGYNVYSEKFSEQSTSVTFKVKAPESMTATYKGTTLQDGATVTMNGVDNVTITCDGATTYKVTYGEPAQELKPVSEDTPNVFAISTPATYTFTASNSEGDMSITVTFEAETYTLVTDVASLQEGDKVIIVANSADKAMATSTSSNRISSTDFQYSDDAKTVIINPPTDVTRWRLVSDDNNGWYLNASNYGDGFSYLYSSAKSNLGYDTTPHSTTITIDENAYATIDVTHTESTNSRIVVLNSNYFTAFENSPTASNAVKIFKYVNNRNTAPEQPEVTFANMPTTTSNTYKVWEDTDVTVYSEGATYIYQKQADGSYQEVAVSDSYRFNVGSTGGTYTFKGVNAKGESDILTVTFEIKAKIRYKAITSTDQLVEGHTYVLATPQMSYTTVEGKTTYTGKAMKNVTGNDRVATDVVFEGENSDVLYIDSNDVLLWNFVKQNADNPNAVPGYDWAIKAVNYVDGVYYLEESSSGSSVYLNMKSDPVYHSITINAENGNAAITTNTVNNYQILYRSTSGYTSFRSFSNTNENNSSYGAVRIYAVDVPTIFTPIASTDGTELYNCADPYDVVFRHDNILWVGDGAEGTVNDQGVTLHLVADPGVELNENVAIYHLIKDFNVKDITKVSDTYYKATLVNTPDVADNGKEPVWLNWDVESSPITDQHYGHGVILYGTLTENGEFQGEDNKVYYLNADDDSAHLHPYNVKKYFNRTVQENTTEIKAPKRYDTSTEELTWAAYNSDWDWLTSVSSDSSTSENATKVYLGGMIDRVGAHTFVYPVSISTDRNIVVSVDRVSDDEQAYLVGRDLYLPEGAELYTVGGVHVAADNLANGIYVVRYANGKAAKILVK